MGSNNRSLDEICKPNSDKRKIDYVRGRKYPKMFETYFIFRQQKIEFKPMSGVIMLLCNRIFCYIFGWFLEPNYKKLFYLSALELFCCLPPLFLLSTPTFLLSTSITNSEATQEKATNATKGNVSPQNVL